MLIRGDIVNTPDYDFACRAQIEFETSKKQVKLLKEKNLGNHQLIFPANQILLLERMLQASGATLVV